MRRTCVFSGRHTCVMTASIAMASRALGLPTEDNDGGDAAEDVPKACCAKCAPGDLGRLNAVSAHREPGRACRGSGATTGSRSGRDPVRRSGRRVQACQVLPQLLQVVGLRPASNARRPIGKKQIATMISHAGNPPWAVGCEHFGHVT